MTDRKSSAAFDENKGVISKGLLSGLIGPPAALIQWVIASLLSSRGQLITKAGAMGFLLL